MIVLTLDGLIAWVGVALGLLFSVLNWSAWRWFAAESKHMDGAWPLDVASLTCLTILVVSAGLTLIRASTLVFGVQPWLQAIAGLLVVWLLMVPLLMKRRYQAEARRSSSSP